MLSGRRKRGSKEVPDFPLERLAQKHFRALLEINCETTKVISFASHAWPGPEWQICLGKLLPTTAECSGKKLKIVMTIADDEECFFVR